VQPEFWWQPALPALLWPLLEAKKRLSSTATATRGAAKDPRTTPIETPSPAPASSAATPAFCDPNPPPPAGKILWRWGDITLHIPPDNVVRVYGDAAKPFVYVFEDSSGLGETYLDAKTGTIVRRAAELPAVDAVLATISVCPFDRATAPWPYNGDPPVLPPKTLGKIRYLEPDPASGIQVLSSFSCPQVMEGGHGGCSDFLNVHSARSEMWIDAETGEPWSLMVAEEDRDAFERYLASIQIQEAE
jgi:hypothetical protein